MDEWEELAPKTPTAWRKIRQSNVRSELSKWESDDMFVAIALLKWPKDMVLRAQGKYKAQAPSSRLRTRYECFETLWEVISDEDKDRVKEYVGEDAA